MAEEILSCDGTDEITRPDWYNVVGDKTLENGGYVGDLLTLTREHLEEAKDKGELREEDAGEAYGAAILASMKDAILFEIGFGKTSLELCLLQAQADKIRADIINDECIALSTCALNGANQAKIEFETSNILPAQEANIIEETALVTEKVESEDVNNRADGVLETGIIKIEEDIQLAKAKVALEQATAIATIDKEMGYEYTLDADGNIEVGASSGDGKLDAEVCVALAQCDLVTQQVLTEVENTALVVEKIETEDVTNRPDGVMENQILKLIEDVKIAKTQLALEQSLAEAKLDKEMGYDVTLDADGNISNITDAGDGKLDAEVDLIFANKGHVIEQTEEIPLESARRDCTTTAECALKTAQVTKLECECKNDTDMTDSKISLNAAQENKLACDCCNQSKIADKQADLYTRQAEGFDDNANQKLYDTQMNAWAMVFADTDLEVVTPSITDAQVCETYTRLRNRLSDTDTGVACATV